MPSVCKKIYLKQFAIQFLSDTYTKTKHEHMSKYALILIKKYWLFVSFFYALPHETQKIVEEK